MIHPSALVALLTLMALGKRPKPKPAQTWEGHPPPPAKQVVTLAIIAILAWVPILLLVASER